MKKIFTLSIFAFFVSSLYGQHEADNWYFGVLAGLNFSSSSVSVLTDGTLVSPEGCATISDSAGNLLFYTDGSTVWNSQHTPMPNGTGLFGGNSSSQGSLIVPQPGSTTIYYLFTTDEIGGPNGFRYSIVDMSLQAGLGDVTTKNFSILTPVTEKLTAVTTYDFTKSWILVHGWGDNTFYAFSLTSSGLNLTPVQSNSGIIHNTSVIQNTYGQMKFSSCGNRLALAVGYQDTVELFDFNIITGKVFNPLSISFPNHVYGIEFSPNDARLYVTCYYPSATLMQYDLTLATPADIINSGTVISTTEDLYGMQLAPDGKIYIARSYNPYLAAVNDPDLPGTACDYTDIAINLDPGYNGATSSLSLPNFVQSYFNYGHKGCDIPTAIEEVSENNQLIYPNPSEGFIHISNAFIKEASAIDVYDVAGRNRLHLDIEPAFSSSVTMDVSSLEAGVYLLHLNNGGTSLDYKIFVSAH